MKKVIASLLSLAMLVMALPVFAADGMTLETEINYDTETLTVKGVTPAKYGQKISVVAYKTPESVDEYADITNKENPEAEFPLNSIAEIKRMDDCFAEYDGKYELEIPLGNMAQGYYVVSVSGNGYMSNVSKESEIIYFESKQYIKDTTLPAINGAQGAALESIIREKEVLFAIDITGWYEPDKDTINELIVSVKNEDYNGAFTEFGNVQEAIKTADLLLDVYDLTTAAGVETLIEANADYIGIDITDANYKQKKTDVSNVFLGVMANKKPVSKTGLRDAFVQSIAMNTINNHVSTQIAGDMASYANFFKNGFLSDYISACQTYGETEINKAFVGQNFTQPDQVVTALATRINAILEENQNNQGDQTEEGTPGTNAGGGGGGGGYTVTPPIVVPNPEVETPSVSAKKFSDVNESHWAYKAVTTLSELGVINGVGADKFAPDDVVTRGAFLKMVVSALNLEDSSAKSEFTDVDVNGWAYPYISAAVKSEIVTGYPDNTFLPNATITRQDAAVLAARACVKTGVKLMDTTGATITDSSEISDYAKDSITSVTKSGVMTGFEDGSFRPLGTLTRAQAAKLIYEIVLLAQ